MTRLSLKARLRNLFRDNPETWFAKGAICDSARRRYNATGEHTGRRLRSSR